MTFKYFICQSCHEKLPLDWRNETNKYMCEYCERGEEDGNS